MQKNWENVKISALLIRKKDTILIDDRKSYKRLTIKMHNKGISVRDEVEGSQIGTKNQFVVKSGWLLLSKIDARNGAFGIIPEAADGGIITGNFWAYELNLTKIDPQFFFYFSYSELFLEFCIASSQGATNRRYLQEQLFLNKEILLPSLSEQKRIVANIMAIEKKVFNLKNEKKKLFTLVNNLIFSWINSKADNSQSVEKYLKQVWRKEAISKDKEYKILGAHWYAEGLYIKEALLGNEIRAESLYKVKKGDFVYNRLFAWKGAFAIVTDDLEGCYISGEFPCFESTSPSICQLILKLFSHPTVWDEIFELSKGTSAISRKRFKEEKFLTMRINSISDKELSIFEKINNYLNKIKTLNLESAKIADALMPSVLVKAFNGEL